MPPFVVCYSQAGSPFLIRKNDAVADATYPDCTVVRVYLPLVAEPHLSASPWCVYTVCGVGEVFRSIMRPKGEASWQELSAAGKYREHSSSAFSVFNLIEAFARVEERHPRAPGDFPGDAVC